MVKYVKNLKFIFSFIELRAIIAFKRGDIMIKKWIENGAIVQIGSAICTFLAIVIFICKNISDIIVLNFVYDLQVNLLRFDLWETLFNFIQSSILASPAIVIMFIIFKKKYEKSIEDKVKEIPNNHNRLQTIKEKIYNLLIIGICASAFVYLNQLVNFNNENSFLSNIFALIINDIILYIILYGILHMFIKLLVGKNWQENIEFIKNEFKTKKEKRQLILIISMGVILGIIICLGCSAILNIYIEYTNNTNYSILDENITYIDDNKIETDVILYQTNDYLIVSDCVIDLKNEKIIIYKSTSEILENRNIHTTMSNFKKKEIKQRNIFNQVKREKENK